jgi:hypothetical protein
MQWPNEKDKMINKQWSTKNYTENWRLSNMNPTKSRVVITKPKNNNQCLYFADNNKNIAIISEFTVSVIVRFTTSVCSFGIFKHFLQNTCISNWRKVGTSRETTFDCLCSPQNIIYQSIIGDNSPFDIYIQISYQQWAPGNDSHVSVVQGSGSQVWVTVPARQL